MCTLQTLAIRLAFYSCSQFLVSAFQVHREPKTISNFINFVDNTLIQCRHSKLKKFTVDIGCDEDGVSFTSIDTWIRYAVGCNVEKLRVAAPDREDCELNFTVYEFPVHLLTNSSVTSLTLICVELPRRQISWTMLKRLSIWWVELTEELIENMLLGSPMLEYLKLCSFRGCGRLNINSASLKELVLKSYTIADDFSGDVVELEVSGPNILSLDITGCLSVSKVVLHSLPSLVKLHLDFKAGWVGLYLDEPAMWIEIFKNISHVPELAVGYLAMKVLSSLELDGWTSPLSKRTLLKTHLSHRCYLPGLANLLQSSPSLERLLIDPSWYPDTGGNFSIYQNSFHCLQNNLKFVKIFYFSKDDWCDECELARFLLEKATVLEQMVISVGSFRHSRPETQHRIQLHDSEKYLSLPRASKKALVVIEDLKVRRPLKNF